ncbi:nicotinate-nucleotide-dimethylbenzimidazole phosphoribosyltransferase [Tindallia magadiensis]|uniref:Nicotinate-nucleotide--dimethylbenzimidazole phosphoribosyltransferase n=1 Tax=Tindallia magadiensis TaxID=69895 RepID=A0A1I3C0M4_9FIRM|nr:nicotinate-nucleotide--dimethylbenzimidazole phosphoribosyltransferase [Tindallia magadiensis]SFH67759.1 nicotinate-nucleotide-dimethylbenzimidazole phosphoribosyltransferase [Tindallia magadiensis]
MLSLKETIDQIQPLNKEAMDLCQKKLDNLTKPPGSLGVLEDIAIQLAGITGNTSPSVNKKTMLVMAGDHGVVAEGVSAFPQEVTPQMVLNFINGGAAINVFCRHAEAKVVVVDVGIVGDFTHPDLIQKKIKQGTNNIATGPAMSYDEAIKAIEIGIEMAYNEVQQGASLLAAGEMGIGNTTPSSAILAACIDLPLEQIVGRGSGIQDEALTNKVRVIQQALDINQPDASDGVDLLAKVGGLEIAAMTGVMLGAAAHRVPVMVDGFIASAAALAASRICPDVTQYMIASHASMEPGHQHALRLLGLTPMLHMNMRLGEGTGAALAFHLVEASTRALGEMSTFADAGVTSS